MHLFDYARTTISLDGEWVAIPEQYEIFEGHPIADSLTTTQVPEDDLLNFDIVVHETVYLVETKECRRANNERHEDGTPGEQTDWSISVLSSGRSS